MSQIRLRIVGESVIEIGDKRITPSSPQLFAVLLYLGTEHDREIPRAELLELLYPASHAARDSAHRLRQLLYKLRGIGAPIIFTDHAVKTEAHQVRSDARDLVSGSWDVRRERLVRSFEVLPHYVPPEGTPLSEWVEKLREKLHNAIRQRLTHDMEVARTRADWRHLEAIARRTMELDPLNESAVLALAEATARTGSKARAISILDAYRAELGEERANLALPAWLLQKRINATRERVPFPGRFQIPLVGREREVEFLLAQWQSGRRGSAQVLWVTGNKSVGKSRLVEEIGATVTLSGSGQVATFSMSPTDTDRPLSLIAALANRLSSLPGAAGCDPSSLLALGKLSGSIAIPSTVNPDNRASNSNVAVRNALCDLITCVCDERSTLVIVDDAQHRDDASIELIDAVLRRACNARFLLVLCGIVDLPTKGAQRCTLHLEPLSSSASKELWDSLLCAHESQLPDAISQKCLETGSGNPGYLELLAQQAIQDPEQFLIPVDLITLTDRRLSQLSTQARYALEAIIILDDLATPTNIAYLTGLPTYDLMAALHALESGDLVVTTHCGVRCRSSLIVDRVRATSPSTVASIMEGRVAAHLEKEHSSERWAPSIAWRIASHWQRAGEPRRARAYLRACWEHAVSIGQPTQACTAITEALSAATDPDDRASLLDDLIGALQAAGESRALSSAVSERRALASRVHDSPARAAQLAFDQDEVNWARHSQHDLSVDSFRSHLESTLLNTHRRIRSARILMMYADGDLDGALASYTIDACKSLSPENTHSALLLSYVELIYHTIFGNADDALRIADEIQEQTGKIERSWNALTFERNCAFARQLVGTGATDYDSLERGFAQALDASMSAAALWFAGSLMSLLVDDGDLGGAQRWLTTAQQLARSFAPEEWPIDYLGAQIDIALLSGNFRKAREYLDVIDGYARYQSKRVRNDLYIYRLRVLQFSGGPWSPESHLAQLLSYHEIGKKLTRHDDHMEVLWQTLVAAGESKRASSLLADYLSNHRRERRPCRHILRVRTAADPAWGEFSSNRPTALAL